MAKEKIPDNIKATCVRVALLPPEKIETDPYGYNFITEKNLWKKGLQLRNVEVIETFQPIYHYNIVQNQKPCSYLVTDMSVDPPIQRNLLKSLYLILNGYVLPDDSEREDNTDLNRMGGVKSPLSVGKIEAVVNYLGLTYEGVMATHHNDFDFTSTEIESPFVKEDDPCKADEPDESTPECPTISPIITVGTLESRKIHIYDSHITPEACKDNLFTYIAGSFVNQSVVDSKELCVIEKSEITDSTIISKHLNMQEFSLGSGIEFISDGLCYFSGIKRFWVVDDEDQPAGVSSTGDLKLTYARDLGNDLYEIKDKPGLVESTIEQSQSGVMAIYDSIFSNVEIKSSEFYSSGVRFEDSSITLGIKSGVLNASGVSDQMKIYAYPFELDSPLLEENQINGKNLNGNNTFDTRHTTSIGYRAVSGYGMGDDYICSKYECPEMFRPPDNQIDHSYCEGSIFVSGCAEYERQEHITDFRHNAARLIGDATATFEYENNPQLIGNKTYVAKQPPVQTQPNATYMSPDEPAIMKQRIPNAFDGSTLLNSSVEAESDIFIHDLLVKGQSRLFFNKNTMLKGDLTLRNGSELTTKFVSGITVTNGGMLDVWYGGKLTIDYFSSNLTLSNAGETTLVRQGYFGQNIFNRDYGVLNWLQPEIDIAHRNMTQRGEINFGLGVYDNGGTFPYNSGHIIADKIILDENQSSNFTINLLNNSIAEIDRIEFVLDTKRFTNTLSAQHSTINSSEVLLKGRSKLEIIDGLAIADRIEVDSVRSGVIVLDGSRSVFDYDNEGNEIDIASPNPPEDAPTKVQSNIILANHIEFDKNVLISGNLLIHSGIPPSRQESFSDAYLKIEKIIGYAYPWSRFFKYFGRMGGTLQTSELTLSNYRLTSSVSAGAEIYLERSTSDAVLMNGHDTTFAFSLNRGSVSDAKFTKYSYNRGFAANSTFEDSFIEFSLSGTIQSDNSSDFFMHGGGREYLDDPPARDGLPGNITLYDCNWTANKCLFNYGNIGDAIFDFTFLGNQVIDIYEPQVYLYADDGSPITAPVKVGEQVTPMPITVRAGSIAKAQLLKQEVIDSVDTTKFDMSHQPGNWRWSAQKDLAGQDVYEVKGISILNLKNTKLNLGYSSTFDNEGTINISTTNINENSYVDANQQYSEYTLIPPEGITEGRSYAELEGRFGDPFLLKETVNLVGPNSSIRSAALPSGFNVAERCYLWNVKTRGVNVQELGFTSNCKIAYGVYQGTNAFNWQGQKIDYKESVDVNTGELNSPNVIEDTVNLPGSTTEAGPNSIMGNPVNANIQDLRRYTDEAVTTKTRELQYSSLQYIPAQNITKITLPLSYIDLRSSYGKNLHYLDNITDVSTGSGVGKVVGANLGTNEIYVTGNIVRTLGAISGISEPSGSPEPTNTIGATSGIPEPTYSFPSGDANIATTGNNTDDRARTNSPPTGNNNIPSTGNTVLSYQESFATGIAISSGTPLGIQGNSGGTRLNLNTNNVIESIEKEESLPVDKTFTTFTTKNSDHKVIVSNYEEAKATALQQFGQISKTTASVSNAFTPIQNVGLRYSSRDDFIGDGVFTNVNIISKILGSKDVNKPTVIKGCTGFFQLGSESEATYFDFQESIIWSADLTRYVDVRIRNKSYLAPRFGINVPNGARLYLENGSTNNGHLTVQGYIQLNSSFNNGIIGGSPSQNDPQFNSIGDGLPAFYNSVNVGTIECSSSLIFNNSTNLGSFINHSTDIERTIFTKIKNFGRMSSNYMNVHSMNSGITPHLATVTGLSPSGLAGYFRLRIGAPPSISLDDIGLYYSSNDYSITEVASRFDGTISQVTRDASIYFEPDSFIAQQFLLPFSGQPYQLPPTSVQNDGSAGVAYQKLRGPARYIHIGEEAFFHQQ